IKTDNGEYPSLKQIAHEKGDGQLPEDSVHNLARDVLKALQFFCPVNYGVDDVLIIKMQLFLVVVKVIMESISENCLGWAAKDTSSVLSPYKFNRRDTGHVDVSLTITHCGICYADVAWAKNIPRNTIYPVVPGHEIVGIVKEVRFNVGRFKVGNHVGVGPYVNSCKTCEHCKIREEVHCDAETTHTFFPHVGVGSISATSKSPLQSPHLGITHLIRRWLF
ncbi:hypothetical protein GIB67_009751, partial [Kingdonia uniflora]